MGGCSIAGNVIEREGHDRADINLPGSQLQLLQDVTNIVSSELYSYCEQA